MSKILSISWYKILPPKYGGQKGIALFTKYLSRHHDILFLCSKDNQRSDEPFQVEATLPVDKSQFINPSCWRQIVGVAEKFQPSIIILEHPYHGIAARLAQRKTGGKLVVHSHNIESQRFKLLGKWWWRLLARYERWVHRNADLNLFKTEDDRKRAIELFGLDEDKCTVVPYGIERPVFDKKQSRSIICQRHNLSNETKLVFFAGTLDYKPNANAVELIFKKIAPRLQATDVHILICGRNNMQQYQYLKKLSAANVLYIGEVEDIENYFAAADVFFDPVEIGGGIQSKLVEALGYNLNVVCFAGMADEKLELAGEKIFTARRHDYDELVQNIHHALTESTPTLPGFFEYYSWEKIVVRLNEKLIALND